jgi:hypothetical protein
VITKDQFIAARSAVPFRCFWIRTPCIGGLICVAQPEHIACDFDCDLLAIYTKKHFYIIPTETAHLVFDGELAQKGYQQLIAELDARTDEEWIAADEAAAAAGTTDQPPHSQALLE